MHDLQKHIVARLIHQSLARYRDIKPKDIEGNLFMYHLRQLQKENLVEKNNIWYRLTPEGLRLADTLSLKTLQVRIQPKIVTLIACQNEIGQWLLYRRNRQPFFGRIGFPYGKIHLGETIHQAATRELEEKTGVLAQLTHAGDCYLTTYQSEELVSQMFCHVFLGRKPIGTPAAQSAMGECFWSAISDAADPAYFPGFPNIFELICSTNEKRFFAEIVTSDK
jgi:ADP-ribose pyrophosphatase YjhB (NUDIX family)